MFAFSINNITIDCNYTDSLNHIVAIYCNFMTFKLVRYVHAAVKQLKNFFRMISCIAKYEKSFQLKVINI